MIPVEVCDDQEQPHFTSDRREVDLTARQCMCEGPSRNCFTVPCPHTIMGAPHGVPKPVRVAVLALVTALYHPNPNPRWPNNDMHIRLLLAVELR